MGTHTKTILSKNVLFRPTIQRLIPLPWLLIFLIFAVHAIIRFGGIWNAIFIPISMLIILPLPWLLSSKQARYGMGFKAPVSIWWFLIGPVTALCMLGVCTAAAWLVFGSGNENWFTQHAIVLNEASAQVPPSASPVSRFWIVTIPAMFFSPLAEEFLYRGFMLSGFSMKWGTRAAMFIQASAFALVHLAHYGLNPIQPGLIAVWLPSMFLTAVAFGWIVQKSGSVWISVLSHSIFNLGLNAIAFLAFPELVGL